MLSGEQVEDISNIDSCQATVTSKETIQTVTAYTTSTVHRYAEHSKNKSPSFLSLSALLPFTSSPSLLPGL